MNLTVKYSNILICLFLLCYPAFHPLNGFKFSSPPRIILPYNKGLPSNYTLKLTASPKDEKKSECFEWKSSNPRVVTVIPIDSESSGCANSAIVSSVADLLKRDVTVISVTERESRKKLYCEVITDTVKDIELVSLTDELILGGSSPAKLSVIAKDDKGRPFSSISGLEIKWGVTNENDDHEKKESNMEPRETVNVVRLTRFDISEYETPRENELEKRGILSSTVLAEPVEVGTAVISATLLFNGNPVLQSNPNLTLKVFPNLKIRPSSPLYLLPYAKVNLTMEKLKSDDENLEITADNIEIEDSSVICDKSLKEIYSKSYISSYIMLHANDIKVHVDLHVVKVSRIGFRVSNGGYNILEELKVYEFFIDLFDEDDNVIHPSDNLRLDVKFPPKLFHIIYTTPNGTYSLVQTTSPGRSKVRAEFKGVLWENNVLLKNVSDNPVKASLVVSVCQRLRIFPPYTLLPVLHLHKPMHKISLKVYGGSGNYLWSLNNYEVAKILDVPENNNTIELEIYDEIDDLFVIVTDLGNINFISTAKVSCQVPIDLEVFPSVVEAKVSDYLIIPVALLGYEDRRKGIIRKFDDCQMVNEVEIVDSYVISHEKESYIPAFGKGCRSLEFKCKAPGHSRINIQYTVDSSKNITYKTTTVLACHKSLKPVYPVRVAALPLGSSIDIAFEGGPRRWPLFKEGHVTELLAKDPELVKIELIKDPVRYNKDLTVFTVTCLKIGESILDFSIGNKPSATLPHPAKSESSVKIVCDEPHSLHLKLFRKQSHRKLDENIVKVPFYGDKEFEIDVYVKDKVGRKFANISSLRVTWSVDDAGKTLAYPISEFDFESHENAVAGYRKLSRNFMKFQMRGGAGSMKVFAKITSYRKNVLEKVVENSKELEKEISKTLDLKLVSLRDLNEDLYKDAKEETDEEGYCEDYSCKS